MTFHRSERHIMTTWRRKNLDNHINKQVSYLKPTTFQHHHSAIWTWIECLCWREHFIDDSTDKWFYRIFTSNISNGKIHHVGLCTWTLKIEYVIFHNVTVILSKGIFHNKRDLRIHKVLCNGWVILSCQYSCYNVLQWFHCVSLILLSNNKKGNCPNNSTFLKIVENKNFICHFIDPKDTLWRLGVGKISITT